MEAVLVCLFEQIEKIALRDNQKYNYEMKRVNGAKGIKHLQLQNVNRLILLTL